MTTTPARARICPRCGTPRPIDEDWCSERLKGGEVCGRFLDWSTDDPVVVGGAAEPVRASSAATDATATYGRAVVTVDARVEGADPRADGHLLASAAPGHRVAVIVRLRNIGERVRTFTIRVDGHGPGTKLPQQWVTVSDDDRAVELNPFDHSGPTEGSATIVLAPPVDNRWPAGDYGFAISVRSPDDEGDFPCVIGTLRVQPRFNAVATAAPAIVRGRRSGRFSVIVLNNANFAFSPQLKLSDAEDVCTFTTPQAPGSGGPQTPDVVAPRGELLLRRVVRAPRPLIGRPVDRQITIEVTVAGEEPLPPLLVIFRQRPLIPWWLLPLLALLAMLALALYLLWPRTVRMPLLVGQKTEFRAQQEMTRAGLTAAPKIVLRARPPIRAGTILQQNPPAGRKVAPNQAVILYVASPPAFTLIPDLIGYTWDRAKVLLDHAHLQLGDVLPSKNSRRKVIRQSPRPGRARLRGTVVDVVLAGRPLRNVPKLRCLTAKQAQQALERKGFRLFPVPEFLDPLRLVRDQMPAAQSRQRTGREIRVFFFRATQKALAKQRCESATTGGQAPAGQTGSVDRTVSGPVAGAAVAFDDGHDVRLSQPAGVLGAGRQAAWSVDGRLLALRSGEQIAVRAAGAGPHSRPIATARAPIGAASMPAFAPVPAAGGDNVLAFLSTPASGRSRICLTAVATGQPSAPVSRALTTSCALLPGIRARTLAWSPDAETILVTGARPEAPERPGIVRLQAIAPAASDVSAWQIGRHLLRPRSGTFRASVFDVAFDPSARRLALTTDLGPTGKRTAPRIVLAPVSAMRTLRGGRWLRGAACQVAFSADGAWLAAVRPAAAGRCGAASELGRLVTFAVDAPRAAAEVTARASRPAWRPAAGGGAP